MIRGLVLAGGKSLRFGTDKALAVFEGRSFLERAVSLLSSLNLKTIVVTRRRVDYPLAGCKVIYDKLPEKGPLGGLYTAMSVFKGSSFLVLPCDMPALTPEALLNLLVAHESHSGVTAYSTDAGLQPFPAIYESSLLETIRGRIKDDELSVRGLLDTVPARKLVPWEGDPETFRNINYRDDLTKKFSHAADNGTISS